MFRRFNLEELRKHIMEVYGEKVLPSGNKFRTGFSTHPGIVKWNGFSFKVLSHTEALEVSKTKARNPQRILVWCEQCRSWQYAGKFAQHRKRQDHQVKEMAA